MIARSLARRTVAATLLTAAVSSLVFAVASVVALRLLWDRHDAVELRRTADAAERIFVLEQAEAEHGAAEAAREALEQALEPLDRGAFRAGRALLAERGADPGRREDGRLPKGWIETRRRLADVVRASAESGEREVEVEAPDEALVRGDEELLRLAVDNLLDNARKYAPADRVPRAVLAVAAGEVTLSVETPGVSLPEEEREQVFERFYRGSAARETAPGHGLGLSLARHVARVHGGDVVAGESGGERTVFRLRLPGWRASGS